MAYALAVLAALLIGAGYLLSPAPAGGGLSHAVDLRYQHVFADLIGVGLIGQIGYGEDVLRAALMPVISVELAPIPSLILSLELAAGWQLLSGTVEIEDRVLEGTEARGLRAELAAGLAFGIASYLAITARGGAALEGVYAKPAQSTAIHPFGQIGFVLEL